MLNAIILAALSVVPVYTNHNRVAGNVQTMTNIQQWAQAVETAISQGGGAGLTTNDVNAIMASSNLCTVAAAQAKYVPKGNGLSIDTENGIIRQTSGYFLGFAWIVDYYGNTLQASLDNKASTDSVYTKEEAYSIFAEKITTETSLASKANSADVYTKTETDAHIGTIATNVVTPVEQTVSDWETYWRGDRVRLSVTNYYGNTSGEPPRLRIEEFDHSVTNNGVVSNFYHVVWDETTRQTNYMAVTDAKVDAISNTVMDAAWRQTNLQLVNKAPRAWQNVTSAGEDAPPNTVWHTAPQTVFAGGTEYAHVAVGEGTIAVLVDKGAPVFTEGAEGQFRFQDQSGQNYFGFDVRSSYKLGCNTDGISVNHSTHIVSLTYDLTSSTNPSILHSTNLVDWADAVVEWETNPPAGTKVCYINCGNDPKGFYQAELRYAGGSKFLTNMQADLKGGIAASNQTLNVIQSVEPYIVNGQVLWRVKQ